MAPALQHARGADLVVEKFHIIGETAGWENRCSRAGANIPERQERGIPANGLRGVRDHTPFFNHM